MNQPNRIVFVVFLLFKINLPAQNSDTTIHVAPQILYWFGTEKKKTGGCSIRQEGKRPTYDVSALMARLKQTEINRLIFTYLILSNKS